MGKRILIFSTYTIKNPQHGGQKRVAAIVKQYRQAGHIVEHVAIQIDQSYPDHYKGDITVSFKKYQAHRFIALVGDLLLSDVLQEDKEALAKFSKTVNSFRPDVVEVEQPFLYKTIREALNTLGWQGAMVNNTQNIEAHLKQQILENTFGATNDETAEIVSRIADIESFAASNADWSIACTEEDAKVLKKMGARETVLAPNGIDPTEIDEKVLDKLKDRFNGQKIILYVGSAHPPNLTGFVELIGGRLGFLGQTTKLVVVGGVADLIYGYTQTTLPNYIRELYDDWVVLLGRIDEKTLSALLKLSDQIILPILEGGGSNLKTAEAILADKKVVATTKSFHSYERYLKLPNITIADDSDTFIRAMYKNINTAKISRTTEEKALAGTVLWENALKSMVKRG